MPVKPMTIAKKTAGRMSVLRFFGFLFRASRVVGTSFLFKLGETNPFAIVGGTDKTDFARKRG